MSGRAAGPGDPKRARAEALREIIAADLQSLRRDAVELMPGHGRARRSLPSRAIPGWALAAAAGTVAGVIAGLRRRAKR